MATTHAPVPTQAVEQGAEALPVTVPALTGMGTPGGPTSEVPSHVGDINEVPTWFKAHAVFLKNATIDTGMQSGTVIAEFYVHPSTIPGHHWSYCKFFGTWGGSLDITGKIFATAFHGGAIGCARVPPYIKSRDIATLQQFSILDWHMSDIRNTEPMTFNVLDQRKVMYHETKEFNKEDPATFGGSIVFFVISPLIVGSAQGIQQVNMAFFGKLGANFTVAQMLPAGVGPEGPLNNYDAFDHALDFAYPRHPLNAVNNVQAFYVFPSNVVQITNGFFGSVALDGKFENRQVQGNKFDLKEPTCPVGSRLTYYSPGTTTGENPNQINAAPRQYIAAPVSTAVTDAFMCVGVFGTGGEGNGDACNMSWRATGSGVANSVTPLWVVGKEGKGISSAEDVLIAPNIVSDKSALHPQEYSTTDAKLLKFGPGVTESFFVFSPTKTTADKYYSIQTWQLMEAIKRTAYTIPDGYAMVFELIDSEVGLPIREVKLYRDGYFTTNATTTPIIITALNHKLVFKNLTLAKNPLAPKPALSVAAIGSIASSRSHYVRNI